jgi:UDP-glucose 4-epimerase
VLDALAAAGIPRPHSIASDIGAPADHHLDVRDRAAVHALLRDHRPDVVVHLAAIVTPPRGAPARLAWDVDIGGTRNVLAAAVATGASKLIVTSSGAAYGYCADNPAALSEDDALRGNQVFAYAHHKRLVEGLLADYRARHPALRQLVLRVGTILGAGTHNQITAIFERPIVLGLSGTSSPFNFVWDQDVAAIIARGAVDPALSGIYNVAGDGVMTLAEIARALGKPYLALPVALVRGALGVLSRLGLSPYGPEQVLFLQHRPVLANTRLVSALGHRPKPTREVLALWRRAHG